jgi:hypothetical protein
MIRGVADVSPKNARASRTARFRADRLRQILMLATMWLSALLTGCPSKTLFQSSFNSQSVGAPPAANQAVGTSHIVSGAPGSVVIVGPVAGSSENWVQLSRAGDANQAPITVWEGDLSQVVGDGTYGFLAVLVIPSGSGLATVEFDTSPASGPPSAGFLHVDFLQNNTVRINDDPNITFGTFPRDRFFTLSVGMTISASSAVAHLALFGEGASGAMDYNIPLVSFARQYGAIRLWMGSPWTGSFDATDILVTHK